MKKLPPFVRKLWTKIRGVFIFFVLFIGSIFLIIELEQNIKNNTQLGGELIDKIGNSQILATLESMSIIGGVIFYIFKGREK